MENEGMMFERERPRYIVKTPIITYLLIAATILVYLIEQYFSIKTGSRELFMWGAKNNLCIMQGQYWRFITPIFLHGGLLHVVINTYSLYAVGPEVEKLFGRVKFILIYLLAGILGNVASFAFSSTNSVGASGAIFGLLGALLYLGIKYKAVISSSYVTNIVIMILFNLMYGLMRHGIDNYAHMGGLIGGYLSAVCLGVNGRDCCAAKNGLALCLLFVCIAACLYIGFR